MGKVGIETLELFTGTNFTRSAWIIQGFIFSLAKEKIK